MDIEKDAKEPEKEAAKVMESEGGGQAAQAAAEPATVDETCARCGKKEDDAATADAVRKDGVFFCCAVCAEPPAPAQPDIAKEDMAKEPEEEDPGMQEPEIREPAPVSEGRRHRGVQPTARQNQAEKPKQPIEPVHQPRRR